MVDQCYASQHGGRRTCKTYVRKCPTTITTTTTPKVIQHKDCSDMSKSIKSPKRPVSSKSAWKKCEQIPASHCMRYYFRRSGTMVDDCLKSRLGNKMVCKTLVRKCPPVTKKCPLAKPRCSNPVCVDGKWVCKPTTITTTTTPAAGDDNDEAEGNNNEQEEGNDEEPEGNNNNDDAEGNDNEEAEGNDNEESEGNNDEGEEGNNDEEAEGNNDNEESEGNNDEGEEG